ncbi:MAG: ABC transporter permease [Candidatus Marinimicrobia bacterium]|nr:ABC transporter permease [Candidatus Neomarinimicrobiota bacterium]
MNKKLIRLIVLRYFRNKKKIGLISFTSWVSILGIGLGSFALVITMSILNGFESEVIKRVIDIDAHMRITGKNIGYETIDSIKSKLKYIKYIKSIYPYIYSKVILSYNGQESVVRVKGIPEKTLKEIFAVEGSFVKGYPGFKSYTSDLPGVIVGARLADKLDLYVGDTIILYNPSTLRGLYSLPDAKKFVLTGVFELNIFDYDENLIFMDVAIAQRFLRRGANVDGLEIKLSDFNKVSSFKENVTKLVRNDMSVKSWDETHRVLFGAMKLEKYGSLIALLLIILVAVFNLTSSIIMLIVEKIKEVGILRTMGMPSDSIREVFIRLGLMNGIIGLVTGIVIATCLCLVQQYYKIIPLPSVYYIPYLPVIVRVFDIILIFIAGLFLIFLGSFLPSSRISKINAIRAINYEK